MGSLQFIVFGSRPNESTPPLPPQVYYDTWDVSDNLKYGSDGRHAVAVSIGNGWCVRHTYTYTSAPQAIFKASRLVA